MMRIAGRIIVVSLLAATSCTTPTRFGKMSDAELTERQDLLLTQLLAAENWNLPGHFKEADLSDPQHRRWQKELYLKRTTMEWELGEVTEELRKRELANKAAGIGTHRANPSP
jgi:hypothetical protein